jgi:hypothetical protein
MKEIKNKKRDRKDVWLWYHYAYQVNFAFKYVVTLCNDSVAMYLGIS